MIVDRRVVVLEVKELEAGAAHALVERARDGENAVADGLGIEPAAVLPPEIAVVGVDCLERRVAAPTTGDRPRYKRSADAAP